MSTSDSKFVPLRQSILDNPKVMRLSGEEFKFWVLALVAASRWDFVGGALPDVERLAYWLRYTEGECEEMIERLEAARLIDRTDDGMGMHDWNEWRLAGDRKAADAERQRRHREKKNKACHTLSRDSNVTVTPVTNASRDVTNVSQTLSHAVTPILDVDLDVDGDERESAHAREIVPMRRADPEWEPNPMPDESMTGRSGQDHADLIRAVQILDGHETTRRLGSELRMYVDTPALRNIHGWQMIVAAMTAQRPDKGKTWGGLMAFARNATQSEFDKLNAQAPARIAASSLPTLSNEQLRAQTEEANRKVAEYRRKQAQS